MLLNHTWTIHPIVRQCWIGSPLANREPSPQLLAAWEQSASRAIRAAVLIQQQQNNNNNGSKSKASGVRTERRNKKEKHVADASGHYVHVIWEEGGGNNSRGNDGLRLPHHHLLVLEVRIQEEWSAEIALCQTGCLCGDGTSTTSNGLRDGHNHRDSRTLPTSTIATRFEFCLVRGLKFSYEVMLRWLESEVGCSVSRAPLTPSSGDLAHALAVWIKREQLTRTQGSRLLSARAPARGDDDMIMDYSDNQGHNNDAINPHPGPPKPLTITFQVPYNLAGCGLDTVTATIPPASLAHLCSSIEQFKPRGGCITSRKRRRSHHHGNLSIFDEDTLPVLEAIQCFMQESFRLNIRSFALVKAACGVAALGNDGRFKPMNPTLLPTALQCIGHIVAQSATMRDQC